LAQKDSEILTDINKKDKEYEPATGFQLNGG
jgi:hypothetical protein